MPPISIGCSLLLALCVAEESSPGRCTDSRQGCIIDGRCSAPIDDFHVEHVATMADVCAFIRTKSANRSRIAVRPSFRHRCTDNTFLGTRTGCMTIVDHQLVPKQLVARRHGRNQLLERTSQTRLISLDFILLFAWPCLFPELSVTPVPPQSEVGDAWVCGCRAYVRRRDAGGAFQILPSRGPHIGVDTPRQSAVRPVGYLTHCLRIIPSPLPSPFPDTCFMRLACPQPLCVVRPAVRLACALGPGPCRTLGPKQGGP